MYEHYKPAQEIFVDREKYLSWMDNALERCREKSVILHLRGIGGIGKSTLLNHWTRTINSTVRLDCQQYTEFYSRLDILAKGAVRVGVDLKRFDILWHIRKRFVEGVEPATEKGRDWAKEVLVAIPFIGSLASIGSAIKSVGDTVAPKLKKRYGDVGRWLQDRLGTQYLERLLEILWKEPEHAEFLFLDALLEDINHRRNMDTPLLFLFDHSENVDCENMRWHYSGRKISEMELWYIFVSSLKNCIGVIASRRGAPQLSDRNLKVEERELLELDRNSSKELLSQRGVSDGNFQDKIVSITAGNPFVINAICDMIETEEVSIDVLESLKAHTLDEIRLKTWRRLFSYTKDLHNLVDRAGLLPSFHKDLMTIVAPDIKTDQWERLIRLSFVKPRSNGSFVLHDLARELVKAELGNRMNIVTSEVSRLLREASEREKDPKLLGFALSVKSLDSEEEAIAEAKQIIRDRIDRGLYLDALTLVENLTFQTYEGDVEILGQRGIVCNYLCRYSEAEFSLSAAIRSLEEISPESHKASVGTLSYHLADVLLEAGRLSEAEEFYTKSLELLKEVALSKREEDLYELSTCLRFFAFFYYRAQRASEGLAYALESLGIARTLEHPALLQKCLNVAAVLVGNAGRFDEQAELYQEAIDLHRKELEKAPDSPFQKAHLAALLGNMSFTLSNLEDVEETYREIFEIREEQADIYPDSFAFTKMHYGWFCLRTFRFQKAEEFLNDALSYFAKRHEDEAKGWSLYLQICRFLLTNLYVFEGKIPLARELLDHLLPSNLSNLDSASPYRLATIHIIMSLSGFYHYMINQLSKALDDFGFSIEALERMVIDTTEEISSVIWSLSTYSNLCIARGELKDAQDAIARSRGILESYGTSWWVIPCKAILDGNLALVFHSESKVDEAKAILESTIQVAEKMGESMPDAALPRLAKMLNNLSIILSTQGKKTEALEVLKRSIELKRELAKKGFNFFSESLAVSLTNLGVLLFKMEEEAKGRATLQESIEIQRTLVDVSPDRFALNLASSLQNLAIIMYDEGNTALAKQHFVEARNLRSLFVDKAPELVGPILQLGFEEIVESRTWSELLEPIFIPF